MPLPLGGFILRNRRKKSPAPIYTFAVVWLLLSLILPMYRLASLIAVLLVALLAARLARAIVNLRAKRHPEPEPEPAPQPKPEPVYPPEVQAVVEEGKRAQSEMGRLYASIRDPGVKSKITELMRISDKIVEDAIHDPRDVPQIKKFFDYYLPTTIKLLNAYDRMSDQGVSGTNITGTIQSIESMLDTAIDAFRKQLDSLFADQALDIETDIDVMNTMLRREGLTEDSVTPSSFLKNQSGGAQSAQRRQT